MRKNTAILPCIAAAMTLFLAVGAHAQEAGYWVVHCEYGIPAHRVHVTPPDGPPSWLFSGWGCDDGLARPHHRPRPHVVSVCASPAPRLFVCWPQAGPTATKTACYTYPVYWGRPPATVEVSTWNEPFYGYPCATVVNVAASRPW